MLKGKDVERVVLAMAVRLHVENRILVYGSRTVVFHRAGIIVPEAPAVSGDDVYEASLRFVGDPGAEDVGFEGVRGNDHSRQFNGHINV